MGRGGGRLRYKESTREKRRGRGGEGRELSIYKGEDWDGGIFSRRERERAYWSWAVATIYFNIATTRQCMKEFCASELKYEKVALRSQNRGSSTYLEVYTATGDTFKTAMSAWCNTWRVYPAQAANLLTLMGKSGIEPLPFNWHTV